MIINNLFFHEKPQQEASPLILYGTIKDSIWGNVWISDYSKGLSETNRKLAIPIEKIENGNSLLKQAKSLKKKRTRHLMGSYLKVDKGDYFPDFSLQDTNGCLWSQKDFIGKKTVINFWYTGCGPCLKEMSELGTWVKQYPNVLFIAITFETAEKIKKIVTEKKFHFHQLVNAEKLMKEIGVSQYPITMVLDEEGKILHIESGTSPTQRANILKALK